MFTGLKSRAPKTPIYRPGNNNSKDSVDIPIGYKIFRACSGRMT